MYKYKFVLVFNSNNVLYVVLEKLLFVKYNIMIHSDSRIDYRIIGKSMVF